MNGCDQRTIEVDIVAVPETAGSALYGMVDVLSAAGEIWQTLLNQAPAGRRFDVRIVSRDLEPFRCGYKVPVAPERSWTRDVAAGIVIRHLGPAEVLRIV